jgi:hypothetical protein
MGLDLFFKRKAMLSFIQTFIEPTRQGLMLTTEHTEVGCKSSLEIYDELIPGHTDPQILKITLIYNE